VAASCLYDMSRLRSCFQVFDELHAGKGIRSEMLFMPVNVVVTKRSDVAIQESGLRVPSEDDGVEHLRRATCIKSFGICIDRRNYSFQVLQT